MTGFDKLRYQFRVLVRRPYSFSRSFGKTTRFGIDWFWISPFDVRQPNSYWTSTPISSGKTIGLRLHAQDSIDPRAITVSAYCNSKLDAEERIELEQLTALCLSADEDIVPFYKIAQGFPALRRASRHLYGMRIIYTPDLFASLLLAITLQRASFGRSKRMIESLYRHFGSRLTFAGKTTISTPSPSTMAKVGPDAIAKSCKVGYRAKYVVSAAEFVLRSDLRTIQTFFEMPPLHVQQVLTQVKGIGSYSVSVVSPHPAFPADSWSAPHLTKLLGVHAPQGQAIEALREFAARRFGRWQRHAYEYLVNDLDDLIPIAGSKRTI